jgi:hypothetical protein
MPLTFWLGVVVGAFAAGVAFAAFVWRSAAFWKERGRNSDFESWKKGR